MELLSKILSVVFFPLFMPIYGAAMLFSISFFSYYPINYIYGAWYYILLFGVAIPFICILLLKLLGVIADIRLRDKRDRLLPYVMTGISYIVCAVILYALGLPFFVSLIVGGVALALIIDGVVSYFWKISAHMTGCGAILSGILITSFDMQLFSFPCVAGCVFVCGLVAMARLYLHKHTPGQVLAGFFNGVLSPILITLFF
ncbi:MAG: hypothetical protein MJZ28_01465 [Paludibacteraceae bacterium]|nr:hypothetical protein [Paludibacteraceae bacterium]